MYYHDKRLQYPVRVETPDPLFARQLQQAIGGIEGEIRVCLQYFFQAWGARGPTTKYRDMLLHTATEEIGHIEMLATAVAMNLEEAPLSLQETAAEANPVVNAVMGGERPRHMVEGMLHKHLLSTGLAAFPGNSDGVPFDCSHVYASGNSGGRHVRQRDGRSDRPDPGGQALQCRPRSRHEGHAELPDRARHHASAAMARGDRGIGRHRPLCQSRTASTRAWRSRNSATPSSAPTRTAIRPRPAGTPPVRRWTAKASSRRCRRHRWAKSRCLARRGEGSGAQKEQM